MQTNPRFTQTTEMFEKKVLSAKIIQKKYPQIKPIIEVNDEIADFQFVDRQYLAIAGVLQNKDYSVPTLES